MQNDPQTIQQKGREPEHSSETGGGEDQSREGACSVEKKKGKIGQGLNDLTGQRFDRWVVLSIHSRKSRKYKWECVCDCGRSAIVCGGSLRSGLSKSCGCLRNEATVARLTTPGDGIGGCGPSNEYYTWSRMRSRCQNTNNPSYPDYGGRGITVCERWMDFLNFRHDMGPRPPGTSIDRINNNGNYEPSNCRWASNSEQANNKRNNRLIIFNGETLTPAQWATKTGLNRNQIIGMLKIGWSIEETLTLPKVHRRASYRARFASSTKSEQGEGVSRY